MYVLQVKEATLFNRIRALWRHRQKLSTGPRKLKLYEVVEDILKRGMDDPAIAKEETEMLGYHYTTIDHVGQ